ncbi:hypothetical protein D3C75_1140830 [compost metagenome]
MASAKHKGARTPWRRGSKIEGPDAFGPIDFVTGETGRVDVPSKDINAHCGRRLGGVGMHKRSDPPSDFRNPRDRLKRTDLVVNRHDGNHRHVIPDRGLQP